MMSHLAILTDLRGGKTFAFLVLDFTPSNPSQELSLARSQQSAVWTSEAMRERDQKRRDAVMRRIDSQRTTTLEQREAALAEYARRKGLSCNPFDVRTWSAPDEFIISLLPPKTQNI